METLISKDVALLVLSTAFTIGIAVVAYSVRSLHLDIKNKVKEAIEKAAQADRDLVNLKIALPDKVKEASERTAQVERDLMEFKAQLPRQYVLKDDYIRTISVFEKKLDEIGKDIKIFSGRKNAES